MRLRTYARRQGRRRRRVARPCRGPVARRSSARRWARAPVARPPNRQKPVAAVPQPAQLALSPPAAEQLHITAAHPPLGLAMHGPRGRVPVLPGLAVDRLDHRLLDRRWLAQTEQSRQRLQIEPLFLLLRSRNALVRRRSVSVPTGTVRADLAATARKDAVRKKRSLRSWRSGSLPSLGP
jgi:hypothetical protein